jgi:HEAT repeat protein
MTPLGKHIAVGTLLVVKSWDVATESDKALATSAFVSWAATAPTEVVALVGSSLARGAGRVALAEAVFEALPEEVGYLEKPRVERLTILFRALLPESRDAGVRSLDSPSAVRRAVAVVVAPELRGIGDIDKLGRLALSDDDGNTPMEATEHLGEVVHERAFYWLQRLVASSKGSVPHGLAVALLRLQTPEALLLLLKAVDGAKYPGWDAAIEVSPGTEPRGPLAPAVRKGLDRLLKSPAAGKREFAIGLAAHWRLPETIELLKGGLVGKGGNDLRYLAAKWSRSWVDPRTTEMLLGALKSKSEDVRRVAIVAMGERRVTEAVEPLRGLLRKARYDEKAAVRAALAQIEPSEKSIDAALKPIPVGLSAIDRNSRAIGAVTQTSPRNRRVRLIHELLSSDLGARAVEALAAQSDPSVAGLIAKAATVHSEENRAPFLAALWKLSELGEEPKGEFSGPQRICRRGPLAPVIDDLLAEVTKRVPADPAGALAGLAESQGDDLNGVAGELSGRYLVAAMLCLDRMGARAVAAGLVPRAVPIFVSIPPLTAVDLLRGASDEMRSSAISGLALRARSKESSDEVMRLRALLDQLQPPPLDEVTRRAVSGPVEASRKAIQTLSRVGDASAIAGLRRAAEKHRNGYVRAGALEALTLATGQAAVPLLKRALKAKSQAERSLAAVALASFGNKEGQGALKKLLSANWSRLDLPDLDVEETRPPTGLTTPLREFLQSLVTGTGDLSDNAELCIDTWAEGPPPPSVDSDSGASSSRDVAMLVLQGGAGIRGLWELAEAGQLG